MLKRKIVIFLGLSFALPAGASKWSAPSETPVTVRFGSSSPQLTLDLEDDVGSGHTVNLVANAPSRSFVSLGYDWFGATVSWANPTTSESDRIYGLSTATDFQFRFFLERFNIETFYQKYKGYYVDNSQDFGQPPPANRIQFPDLQNEHYGVEVTYSLNSDSFSTAAAFDQSKQQLESGASWLLSAGAHYNHFSNSGSMIPTFAQGTFGSFENVRGGQVYSLFVGGGGGGTWAIYGNWFLSGSVLVGLGGQVEAIDSVSGSGQGSNLATESNAKISMGYNGQSFICGLTAYSTVTSYRIENVRMMFSAKESAVFVGTRF